MKKLILIPVAFAITLMACNSDNTSRTADTGKTPVDSLKKEIDDVHILGMSKMARLNSLQNATQRFIDSLSNLPGKAKEGALSLRARADSILGELNYADYAMNTWMNEYYVVYKDTLANKSQQLLDYLQLEKEKSSKVTDAILEGIKKAELLLSKQ